MEVSANFAFLKQEFPHAAESASFAERHVFGDPRASCFHARHALERLLKRVYKVEKALKPPKVTNLDGYISDPAFRELVPEVVWQKAEYVRQAGNVAVHGNRSPAPEKALDVVRELYHVLYWTGRTYLRKGAESLQGKTFDESLVPNVEPATTPASVQELEALKAQRDAAAEARKEIESELEALRERLAAIKAENEGVHETHDWNEDKTRTLIIDLDLERAGWPLDRDQDREYEVTGMPNESGIGYADYVLWGDDGKPLAVVEAKKTTVDPAVGQQQAKLYADCLETMHGQRPVIFYTNGYETRLWDDLAYPPRPVAGFYKKDELASLIIRRAQRAPLDVSQVKDDIVERYYQKRAIGSIGEQFAQTRRKALLVMATGSGKTRTAIALVDLLQRAGWVKRALFLADRVSLVNQAVGAFRAHLPQSSPVNLVTEKDTTGRVYVCTYPTMMGLINETTGSEARFSVGHFDLVIIDEAHRSVYQKYGAIFRYFDSLLIGLTATPREQVDRNTYALFDLEPGVPTDAYELETAVADGFLVPPRVQQVDLQFPREGIDYDSLSDEEQGTVGEPRLGRRRGREQSAGQGQRRRHQQLALQQGHGGQGAPAPDGAWPHSRRGGPAGQDDPLRSQPHARAVHRGAIQSPLPAAQGITSRASLTTMRRIRRVSSTTSHRRTPRRTSPSRWTCSTPASTFPRSRTWSSSSRSTRRSSSGR